MFAHFAIQGKTASLRETKIQIVKMGLEFSSPICVHTCRSVSQLKPVFERRLRQNHRYLVIVDIFEDLQRIISRLGKAADILHLFFNRELMHFGQNIYTSGRP